MTAPRPEFATHRIGDWQGTQRPRRKATPAVVFAVTLIVVGVVLLVMSAHAALAQALTICAPRPALLAALAERGERPLFVGLSGEVVVEMLVAPGGEWSLITTEPDGTSCILASGVAAAPVGPRVAGAEREG